MLDTFTSSYYVDMPKGKPTAETIDEFRKLYADAAEVEDNVIGDAEYLKQLVDHYDEWGEEEDNGK